jgi:maleate isomerase
MNRLDFVASFGLGSVVFLTPPAFAEASVPSRSEWQPDGLGYRARIGLLTPNDDAVLESEFWTMAPEGVSIHVSRMLLANTHTIQNAPIPDDATALLAALPMQAIVYGFTTTSYLLGPDGERALAARLEKRSNGIPVLLTGAAAVAAFRAVRARRIALFHPPWFDDSDQELGVAYFRNQGFDVVHASQMRLRGLSIATATSPLRQFTEIYPAELYGWARSHVPADAEAILFSGNGFRAIGVIAELEEDLGRPVLSSNQVALWYALRQAGVRALISGYGQLFNAANAR